MAALLWHRPAFLAWACVLVLSFATRSSAAQEQKRAATLHWVRMEGAESCADGIALSRAVDAKLGREVFTAPSEAQLIVEGRVEPTEVGFRAQLRLLDEQGGELGSREVLTSQPDCRELAEAVAVVLAVLVDPDGALASSTPAAAAAPVVVGPPAPAPPSAVTPEVKTPTPCPKSEPELPEVRPEANATMFARFAFGQLPKTAYGLGLALEVAFPGWGGGRIEGAGFLDQTSAFSGLDARARFRMLYGGLALCPLWLAPGTRVRVSLCVGTQVGVVQTRTFATVGASGDHSELLFQADATGRASYRVWRDLAVHMGASLVVPVRRTLYEAQRADGSKETLFEARAIGGSFDLGFGAHF